MGRPKKELVPSAPVSRTASLISRLRDNGNTSICSVSQLMQKWRYVDFMNPTANLPAISLEWLFGARGLLAGRIVQLRATYSKGKSSFMYLMYAAAQRMSDAFCFHVETEGAVAPADFIWSFGCDPDKLAVDEIRSLEVCLSRVDEVIAEIRGGRGGGIDPETGRERKTKYTDPLDPDMTAPIVIGIDSLSSLGLDDTVSEDIADLTRTPAMALHSRKLRDYMRRRCGLFTDSQALIMLASHETAKIEQGKKSFGGPGKSSLAQEAIGIHATYAVDIDSNSWVDKATGTRIGDKLSLYTTKNKISPRYRKLELFMRTNAGFDLIDTDAEFLLSHPASPFTKDECYKQGGNNSGIKCPALSDKVFKSNEEFIRALYANTDFVMALREKLRIRGCGFAFETQYRNGVQTEFNDEETTASVQETGDMTNGLVGSTDTV